MAFSNVRFLNNKIDWLIFSKTGDFQKGQKKIQWDVPERRSVLPSGNDGGLKIDIMKHLNEQKEPEDKMPMQEQHKYLIL